jgi:hypothetical protein
LEVRFARRLDRNPVYSISSTTTGDIRASHNVSTVGTTQLRSSQQSPFVHVIVQEQVQAETAQLGVEAIELGDKVNVLEQLLATLTGTYAPPRCPPGSDEDWSLPPPPVYVH